MRSRGRGVHDVGLSEAAAAALRECRQNPDEWTCVEVWDAKPSLRVGAVLRKDDVTAETMNEMMIWLNRVDPYLQLATR